MSQEQEKDSGLEKLESEAAGFMNPFKWGKKKKEEAPPTPAAQTPPPPPAAAPAPPPAAAAPQAPAAPTTPAAAPKPAPPAAKPAAPAAKPAAAATKAKPQAEERTYRVKAGDTLWDIAANYYGDGRQYMKIAKANNIANPNQIDIGWVLKIPD
ncbi:LysM peptidoglycan-binding domain-containing protein [Catellatospora tritici]|uniref:LysM peptidoglycan-binding domain-containing protein n=1 Tax=Catellatospora tritici TaxID=2851566 RepID=UPI001C2CD5CE|nr:LysM domain-containing protein [Catellatospora tritici]MBV1848947.1 LysM peptidoglycan-binding domain-containing protein [Catellatospora tritici]